MSLLHHHVAYYSCIPIKLSLVATGRFRGRIRNGSVFYCPARNVEKTNNHTFHNSNIYFVCLVVIILFSNYYSCGLHLSYYVDRRRRMEEEISGLHDKI